MKTSRIFFLLMIVFSCKGPAGDVGPKGDTGSQGVKGDTGSANITTTPWVDIKQGNWFQDKDEKTYFSVAVKDNAINQNVLDKGSVMAYFRYLTNTAYIFPLPYVNKGGTLGFVPLIEKSVGYINFYLDFYSDTSITFDSQVRWVIIPDLTVRTGRLANVDWKNYEEVKIALNLKD
jgi:hypothetical protein